MQNDGSVQNQEATFPTLQNRDQLNRCNVFGARPLRCQLMRYLVNNPHCWSSRRSFRLLLALRLPYRQDRLWIQQAGSGGTKRQWTHPYLLHARYIKIWTINGNSFELFEAPRVSNIMKPSDRFIKAIKEPVYTSFEAS